MARPHPAMSSQDGRVSMRLASIPSSLRMPDSFSLQAVFVSSQSVRQSGSSVINLDHLDNDLQVAVSQLDALGSSTVVTGDSRAMNSLSAGIPGSSMRFRQVFSTSQWALEYLMKIQGRLSTLTFRLRCLRILNTLSDNPGKLEKFHTMGKEKEGVQC